MLWKIISRIIRSIINFVECFSRNFSYMKAYNPCVFVCNIAKNFIYLKSTDSKEFKIENFKKCRREGMQLLTLFGLLCYVMFQNADTRIIYFNFYFHNLLNFLCNYWSNGILSQQFWSIYLRTLDHIYVIFDKYF